jgi:hypothetical protein
MRRVALFSMLTLAACASSGPQTSTTQMQTARVTDAGGGSLAVTNMVTTRANVHAMTHSAEEVFRVLPEIFQELDLPVNEMNRDTRTIGHTGFTARRQLGRTLASRYLDCGRTQDRPSAETYELLISLTTRVQPTDGGTSTLQTTMHATARPVNFPSGVVNCTSTGGLEARIAEMVRSRTGR